MLPAIAQGGKALRTGIIRTCSYAGFNVSLTSTHVIEIMKLVSLLNLRLQSADTWEQRWLT